MGTSETGGAEVLEGRAEQLLLLRGPLPEAHLRPVVLVRAHHPSVALGDAAAGAGQRGHRRRVAAVLVELEDGSRAALAVAEAVEVHRVVVDRLVAEVAKDTPETVAQTTRQADLERQLRDELTSQGPWVKAGRELKYVAADDVSGADIAAVTAGLQRIASAIAAAESAADEA